MRDSAIIYEQFYRTVQKLPVEAQAEAYNAYMRYALYGEPYAGDDLAIECLLDVFAQKIDRANKEYQKKCERASCARERKNETQKDECLNQVDINLISENSELNQININSDSDSDSDSDYVKDITIPPSPLPKRKTAAQINAQMMKDIEDDPNDNPTYFNILKEWMKYKGERGDPYKPSGFSALRKMFERYVFEYGLDEVTEVVSESMSSQYQGIVWDRLKKRRTAVQNKKATAANFEQRSDDLDSRCVGDALDKLFGG